MDRIHFLNSNLLLEGQYSFKLRIMQTASLDAGLGLFTTEPIPAAQDIFSKRLMMSAADRNHLETACDYCFVWLGSGLTVDGRFKTTEKDTPVLQRCLGCRTVQYCSKVCQKKAWRKHHKAECATVAQIQEREAVFRLSLRLVLNYEAANIQLRKEWPLILALRAKSAEFAHHGDMQNLTAFHCFVDDKKQLQGIYYRVKLNCVALYPIVEHEFLGVAIDPLVSIMNHSCEPNANISFEGTRVRVRTLRQIAAGEEITITYIDNTAPKWVRQPILKHKWLFDCACHKCSTTIESHADEVVTTGYSKAILDKMLQLHAAYEFQSPEKAESRLAEVLGVGKPWPPADVYPMSSLYQQLANSYHAKGLSYKEMRYMLHVCFVADPAIYSSRQHPARVCNLVQLAMAIKGSRKHRADTAKAADHVPLEDYELGLAYKYCIMKVADDVDASYGDSSILTRAVKHILMEEAQMATGNWRLTLRLMQTTEMQTELRRQLERLLGWVDIPVNRAMLLER